MLDRMNFLEGPPEEVLARINQAMVAAVPLNAALGLKVVAFEPGIATTVLPWREDLVGNPETGVLHGGAITTQMDATCGLAVFLKLAEPTRIATLDLRIDYLRPATPKLDVRTRAECYRVTRQVAFVRATAFHETPADAIASAAGTFIIFDEGRSPVAEALRRAREQEASVASAAKRNAGGKPADGSGSAS